MRFSKNIGHHLDDRRNRLPNHLLAVNARLKRRARATKDAVFAVVASEVRSLAQRSAVAAKEIKVLIQDSLRKSMPGRGW